MPDGGVLRISARAATAAEVATAPELQHAAQVLVTIADTGVGMPEEVLSQVFNPFFTTKGAGAGTGLGLATVARVVREHGGAIQLASRPGEGATLHVFLPASRQLSSLRSRPITSDDENASERSSRRWHVLLVDDENAVVRAITRVLRRDGHAVTPAFDGRDGLERFRQARPDIVVLDVDMPAMNGIDCFEQMRALDPSVPIIFVSGQSDADREHDLLAAGASAFLHKPLDLALLARAIREALPASPRMLM
jgi:CheY-like chemotaxis protein